MPIYYVLWYDAVMEYKNYDEAELQAKMGRGGQIVWYNTGMRCWQWRDYFIHQVIC